MQTATTTVVSAHLNIVHILMEEHGVILVVIRVPTSDMIVVSIQYILVIILEQVGIILM